MEYVVSLIIYFASIAGVFTCMWGMVVMREERKMIWFFTAASIAFMFTMYLGAVMFQNLP